jgi:hypothetical protein
MLEYKAAVTCNSAFRKAIMDIISFFAFQNISFVGGIRNFESNDFF